MTKGQWYVITVFMNLVIEILYRIIVNTAPVTANKLYYNIRKFREIIDDET